MRVTPSVCILLELLVGHDAIRAGLTWSLGIIEQPHFAVRHELTENDSGLKGGAVLAFTQMFVGEVNGDGLLRRMESYTSYPPPTVG